MADAIIFVESVNGSGYAAHAPRHLAVWSRRWKEWGREFADIHQNSVNFRNGRHQPVSYLHAPARLIASLPFNPFSA